MPSQHFFYAWACTCVTYANEMRSGKESVWYKARRIFSVERMLVESESCVEVEIDSEEVMCHWAFQEAEGSLDLERRERHFR